MVCGVTRLESHWVASTPAGVYRQNITTWPLIAVLFDHFSRPLGLSIGTKTVSICIPNPVSGTAPALNLRRHGLIQAREARRAAVVRPLLWQSGFVSGYLLPGASSSQETGTAEREATGTMWQDPYLPREALFARRAPSAPGIQINVPAIYPNAVHPSITPSSSPGTQGTNDTTKLALLTTKISSQILLCQARSEYPIQTHGPKRLELGN